MTNILFYELIKALEEERENAIPEEIGEMINIDEYYEAWDLAFDKAIDIIKKRKERFS